MGRSTERRIRKEARRLAQLLETDVPSFVTVWNIRVNGWLQEMQIVAARHRNEIASTVRVNADTGPITEPVPETISGIGRRADELIRLCGAGVESLVGPSTREVLDAECARLIASVYGPEMYRLLARRHYMRRGKI